MWYSGSTRISHTIGPIGASRKDSISDNVALRCHFYRWAIREVLEMSVENSRGLSLIRKVLYQMKREYGVTINVNFRTSSTINSKTLQKTTVIDSFCVKRAILFPSSTERNFVYSLPMIASNKNFTYGALFDADRRRILIDAKDIPSGVTLDLDMWLVFDGKRYDFEEIHEYEFSSGFILVVRQATNVSLNNNIKRSYEQPLDLVQTVTAVVS